MLRTRWRTITPRVCDFGPARRQLQEYVFRLPIPERFKNEVEYQDEVERIQRETLAVRCGWAPQWRLALAATVNVLADMARQGWRFRIAGRHVKARPPVAADDICTRDEWRNRLHAQRMSQLREPATREFVRDMETGRFFCGRRVSIFSLMRDGRDLAAKLRAVGSGKPDSVMRPFLQFISEGTTCNLTGFRLNDIWRYFRHTWANPYQSIPGRTMMFLVRDAAAENQPVIGIGALSSASIKMKARDEFIGWEPSQVLASLREPPSGRLLTWLRDSVEKLIEGVYFSDLLEDQIISTPDLRSPSSEAISRLDAERRSQRDIHVRLTAGGEYKNAVDRNEKINDDDWETQARLPLFRSKRAGELAVLLEIRRVLSSVRASGRNGLEELLARSDGRRAVEQLSRRIKAMKVGTAIADLTVCGAVAPYQAILGGKLVAMLAVSPEVVAEYRHRYRRAASVIASSMAGREIQRAADLVFIGTTSLYGVRPCQYDRVAIPLAVLGGPADGSLRYEYIACTEGWGTFHFGKAATRTTAEFVKSERNGAQVNYVFGEGANPKLRALRDGLMLLGFDQETLLNHGMARLIYGVRLASNVREYLLGTEKRPRYLANGIDRARATEAIGQFWWDRWASKRLARTETLSLIEQHTLVHPITHGARVQLPEDDLWQQSFLPR